ncbi:MAG: TldD/PmbA family protein [Deltaproteobacteria bacterium]|nr:TldD/PmbA family protein [Deltaproteobacteria bacterium]
MKMLEVARQAVAVAQKKGAQQAAANAYRAREVSVEWRDGKVDRLNEATTAGLGVQLYVDGRFASVSTSDLRPEALDRFLEDAIVLARALAKDPHRALPDPRLYEGQAQLDLMLEDKGYEAVSAVERRRMAQVMEEGARAQKGAEAIISVTSGVSDTLSESYKVHSNGFEGSRRDTAFWLSAEVSVKDPDGRKPEDGDYAGARFFKELPDPAAIGRAAAQRALKRIGAKKGESGLMTVVIDPRAGGRLLPQLLGPLSASSLQQKRSMFEGKLGQAIGSARLDIADDPHVVKGFGSQLYDSEGMAAKRRPIFEGGVLKTYFVDNYYGRKLGMAPTTARTSNLAWKLGDKDLAQTVAGLKDGLLVTGFLGGNSNATTGDFSLGVSGFRVRGGALAEPVSEMNLSGNHLELWKSLVAVGNDPYPYSSMRIPTLVFEKVQVAGT